MRIDNQGYDISIREKHNTPKDVYFEEYNEEICPN